MTFKVKRSSQVAWVLSELKRGRKLTSMEAFEEMKITRLSGIILILRNGKYDGTQYHVKAVCAPGHGFASYSL